MKTYIVRLFLKCEAMNEPTMERKELHLINFPYIELDVMDDKTFNKPLTQLEKRRIITANVYAFLNKNFKLLKDIYAVKIYDQLEEIDTKKALYKVLDYHETLWNVDRGYDKWSKDNQPFAISYREVKRQEKSIIANLIYDKESNRVYSLVFNPLLNSLENITNMEQYKNLVLEYIANSNTVATDVLEDICVSIFVKGIYYPSVYITRKGDSSDYWDKYIEKELMYGK